MRMLSSLRCEKVNNHGLLAILHLLVELLGALHLEDFMPLCCDREHTHTASSLSGDIADQINQLSLHFTISSQFVDISCYESEFIDS